MYESAPKSVINHKEHKEYTKFTKKNCLTAVCVLCEFPLVIEPAVVSEPVQLSLSFAMH